MSSPSGEPPVFTRADARAHDRLLIETRGIAGITLMERAARGCVEVAVGLLSTRGGTEGARVVVVCGPGQNGGDGYEVARLLAARGAEVEIVAIGVPREGTDAAVTRGRAQEAGLPMSVFDTSGPPKAPFDLAVDALFGTGLERPLEGPALAAVDALRALRGEGVAVLAIDIPSGLDCDDGLERPRSVHADATATMAAPKAGFLVGAGPDVCGAVWVVPLERPDPPFRWR